MLPFISWMQLLCLTINLSFVWIPKFYLQSFCFYSTYWIFHFLPVIRHPTLHVFFSFFSLYSFSMKFNIRNSLQVSIPLECCCIRWRWVHYQRHFCQDSYYAYSYITTSFYYSVKPLMLNSHIAESIATRNKRGPATVNTSGLMSCFEHWHQRARANSFLLRLPLETYILSCM